MSLNPDELEIDDARTVQRSTVLDAVRPIMNEALVAQRLITIGFDGIELKESNGNPTPARSFSDGLATTVVALMPMDSTQSDAKVKRARRQLQEQLLKQQVTWPDIGAIKSTTHILCADHKPSEYGLPRQLYTNHLLENFATWSDFASLLSKLLNTVSPVVAPAWVNSQPALYESLVTLIAETFKNTHDHARQELSGAEVETSIRGLYARYYSLNEIASYPSSKDASTPAERFAKSFLPHEIAKGVRAERVNDFASPLNIYLLSRV